MEQQFQNNHLDCLANIIRETRSAEQTQELRIPDGMPDVSRVISAWGQPVMRGKEWNSSEISFSGGMTVWVLYAPEQEKQCQVISSWVPFHMRWELPDGTPEGSIRISCLCRFVDARSVSPRKLMLRCSMAAAAEVYAPETWNVFTPGEQEKDIQLLRTSYPVKLQKLAGEKTFLLDEELELPGSAPVPEKLIYCTMEPRLQDSRVLTDKLVFRGNGKLHMLFSDEGGQVHSWDFEIPFSQLAELGNTFSADAQADIRLAVTSMEPELLENGKLRLKCGLVGQYLIADRETVEVVEDAYSVEKELELSRETLSLPVILETARENLYGEQTLQANANLAADVCYLPDYPTERHTEDGMELTFPGNFQVLYYGEDGQLHGAGMRGEIRQSLPADSGVSLMAYPHVQDTAAEVGSGVIRLKTEMPVERTVHARQSIPMVTELTVEKEKLREPGRPSVILQRAGSESLWEIAKKNGSTVDAISGINGLEGEPEPGQMLLIPVL